jgi:predicted dehydrogenase
MKKIRIAQVGTNSMTHGAQTLNSILKHSDLYEFVGIAEPVGEWKHNLEAPPYRSVPQYSFEELLQIDDLDAVAIETNEELSTQYAQPFADRGIAVHLEKPGSPDHAAFVRLADTLRNKKLPLHLGYMYRYNPLVLRALDLVKSGRLGEILSVEAQMNCLHTAENRRWMKRFPGGMMYFLGCHLVDLALQIQGMPDDVVPMNLVSGVGGADSEDFGFAVLKYKHGVSFLKTTAVEVNGYARRQLVINGTEGTIEIKPLEMFAGGSLLTASGSYTPASRSVSWADHSEKWTAEPFDRYDAMMEDFAGLVRGEYENPYDYDYEIRVHRLLLRCCGAE